MRPGDPPPGAGGDHEHEDPLAFVPDERDREEATRRPTEPAASTDGGPGPEADPLAFAPDERDQQEAADGPDQATGPASDAAPYEDPGETTAAGRVSAMAHAIGGRYVAVIVLLVVVIGAVSLLTTGGGSGSRTTVEVGGPLPPFAAPLATAPKLRNDDVNLATAANQGQAGRVAACSIADPAVVTSCGLLRRGPLVLVMFSSGVDECVRTVDALDRLRLRFPGVQTLAVAIGAEHDATAAAVRARHWRLPVAYDRDGALSSRLGVAVCPFVLFVGRDGRIAEKLVGTPAPDALARGIRQLLAGPRSGTTRTTPAPGR